MAGAFGQPAYLRTSARQYETLERPHWHLALSKPTVRMPALRPSRAYGYV